MQSVQFDQIVSQIYQASLSRVTWKQPFDLLASSIDAWNVHLMGVDLSNGALLFSHEGGDPPAEGTLDYIRTWHRVDPRAALVLSRPPGQWTHDHEHFDEVFVRSDPFYRDFLIPYGMRYISGIRFEPREGVSCIFSASRAVGKTPFSASERENLARVGFHVEQALRLQTSAADALRNILAGAAVLERIRYPMFLVDAQRHLLFRNAAARRMESGGRGLSVSPNGQLRLSDSAADRKLTWQIKRLELNVHQALENARAESRLELPVVALGALTDRDVPILHLTRIDPEETMGAFGGQPLALITAFEVDARRRLDPYMIQSIFNLTPAEARVAAAIAVGAHPTDVAKTNGVSVNTVRSQLHQVTEKLGTDGQLELAAILSCNPLFWGGLTV